jgi:hypothetical protein
MMSKEIIMQNMFKYFIILSFMLIGCEEKEQKILINIKEEIRMNKFTDDEILTLSNIRLFFGHMSVGYNIIQGIEEIMDEDSRLKKISISELDDEFEISKAGFYHKKNGKNGFPKSKCDDFKKMLITNNFGQYLDIAFFKFCYVDFDQKTNVQDVFNYYVQTIDEINGLFPNLRIIHVTIPLEVHVWGIKSILRNLLKGDHGNIKRNQFNKMLVDKYSDTDIIYDLAQIGSTYPDNRREFFEVQNQKYYSLIKAYTYDGGHLNKQGRFLAAQKLLEILLEITSREYK